MTAHAIEELTRRSTILQYKYDLASEPFDFSSVRSDVQANSTCAYASGGQIYGDMTSLSVVSKVDANSTWTEARACGHVFEQLTLRTRFMEPRLHCTAEPLHCPVTSIYSLLAVVAPLHLAKLGDLIDATHYKV